jgi:uncharacterized protein (TIGR02444 family)
MTPPLWKFSLAVYAGEGVQDECLALQERYGVDVNLLLLCAYLGAAEGAVLSHDNIADAAQKLGDWHDIVRTLRAARRALKPWATDEKNSLLGETQVLRARVKAAELETERLEQAMLWEWSRTRTASRQAMPADALAANLQAFLLWAGMPASEASAAAPNLRRAALAETK